MNTNAFLCLALFSGYSSSELLSDNLVSNTGSPGSNSGSPEDYFWMFPPPRDSSSISEKRISVTHRF